MNWSLIFRLFQGELDRTENPFSFPSGDGLFFTVAYTEVLPASLDLLGFSTVAQRSPCFVPVGCTFVSPVGYRCPRQRFSDQRQPLLHWPRFVGVSYRWSWNTPPFR